MENKLGETIREKRTALGISQEKLGQLVDYPRQHILSIEAGRLSPSDAVLERIATELGTPYQRLNALKILDRLDHEAKCWLLTELLADPSVSPMTGDKSASNDP